MYKRNTTKEFTLGCPYCFLIVTSGSVTNISLFFNRNTCVNLVETADAPPLLPNASSAIEIVFGFPNCPKSDNFTIVGNAMDAEMHPDGSLEINGVVLPSGQFCVERIKELNQIAKVFACPEHAPQRSVRD